MEARILRAEGLLRFSSLLLAVLAACLVGLDTQTKIIFFTIERKATKNDLAVLSDMVVVEAIAAGYQLVQLCKCMILAWITRNPCGCNKTVVWLNFILDQMTAYATFSVAVAASQASCLAITGAKHFQWTKLCNIYSRFCEQIGGGLLCGFISTILMAVVSSISAFHVFRLYSTKKSFIVRGPL